MIHHTCLEEAQWLAQMLSFTVSVIDSWRDLNRSKCQQDWTWLYSWVATISSRIAITSGLSTWSSIVLPWAPPSGALPPKLPLPGVPPSGAPWSGFPLPYGFLLLFFLDLEQSEGLVVDLIVTAVGPGQVVPDSEQLQLQLEQLQLEQLQLEQLLLLLLLLLLYLTC